MRLDLSQYLLHINEIEIDPKRNNGLGIRELRKVMIIYLWRRAPAHQHREVNGIKFPGFPSFMGDGPTQYQSTSPNTMN